LHTCSMFFRNPVPGRLGGEFLMDFGWNLHAFWSSLACTRRFCWWILGVVVIIFG
jgi:hypothetical protein